MKPSSRNYWIIIDHPLQLLMAISISKRLEKRKANKPKLIISRHEYWRLVKIKKYSKYFSNIYWFHRVGIPPFTMPMWKQLLASGLLFFELALIIFKVHKLKIIKGDVILGLSDRQLLENVILSVFKENQKVAIIGEADMFEEGLSKKWRKDNNARYTMGGWIFKFIYSHLFKLLPMDIVLKREAGQFTDADWLQTYTNGFKNVYDKILIVNNITSRLKTTDAKNTMNTYLPYLFRSDRKGLKKKVVYFGMPYLKEWDVTREQHTDRINNYLKFIRKHFGEAYELEYRPHPQEKIGKIKLNLKGFKLGKDRSISELYLFDKGSSVKAVFSVCSVSCRSSLNFGIDSHVYPNLFPIKPALLKTYKKTYGHIPDEFFLKSFNFKPKQIKFFPKTIFDPSEIFEKDLIWAISPDE